MTTTAPQQQPEYVALPFNGDNEEWVTVKGKDGHTYIYHKLIFIPRHVQAMWPGISKIYQRAFRTDLNPMSMKVFLPATKPGLAPISTTV